MSEPDLPRIIWMLWLQGWDRAPQIVDACRRTWQYRNSGWEVRALSSSDIGNVLEGDRLISRAISKECSPAALSDIVRVALLRRYGGVWADSTCYCLRSLDEWLPERLRSGFFAFANPGPDRMLSSWFLAAKRGDYLIEKLYASIEGYWRERSVADDYFWFHRQFADAYTADARFRDIWDKTAKLSADGPHRYVPYDSALRRPASYEERALLDGQRVPLLKLTHKLSASVVPDNSVLNYLVKRAGAAAGQNIDFPLSIKETVCRRLLRMTHPRFGIRTALARARSKTARSLSGGR